MRYVFLFLMCMSCRSYYHGPVSDHYDGEYFKNADPHKIGFFDLMSLMWGDDGEPWPEFVDDSSIQEHLDPVEGRVQVTFINHASFLIQTAGLNILTDPIYSDYASPVQFAGPKRVRNPGIKFDALPEIDVVVISHDHYDHLDETTIKMLEHHNKGPSPLYIVGLGVGDHLESMGVQRYKELDWDQSYQFKSLDVWFVECQHRSGRGLLDHKKALWGSFVIQSPEGRLYFAGDTAYSKHFSDHGERYGPFDAALLPIGAYEPRWFMERVHVSPQEAVQAHFDLKSQLSLGMHFGTFRLTYEGIKAPEVAIENLKIDQGFSNFLVPKFGETFSFPKSRLAMLQRNFAFDLPSNFLSETSLIDSQHPEVVRVMEKITVGHRSQRGKAIAIHDFVRDHISFGWTKNFADEAASSVLSEAKGFAMTKTTLFIALLRAAGIPSRPQYVDISSAVLRGVGISKDYLDHAYAEVFLNGKWWSTDSYVIPKEEADKLKQKLVKEKRDFGYGVALEGSSTWDGKSHRFIQYIDDPELKGREHPYYEDPEVFYRYASHTHNGGYFHRLIYPWVYENLNKAYSSQMNM